MISEEITLLKSLGPRMAKRWNLADGKLIKDDYDNAKSFHHFARPVSGIGDIHDLLVKIEPRTDVVIIRAAVKPEAPAITRRRIHGEDAWFEERSRRWVMLDIDGVPESGLFDWRMEPEEVIREVIAGILPAEFRGVACVAQWSSSMGFEPGIRAHLWFWLDRPLGRAELETWLGDKAVDKALFRPVQVHYTAAPVFDGVDDPTDGERTFFIDGTPEVAVPPLPARGNSPRRPSKASGEAPPDRKGYERRKAAIGDHEGGDGFHNAILKAACSFFALYGADADDDWLREDLRAVILAADRSKHKDAYVYHQAEGGLDDIIAWAQAAQRETEDRDNAPLPAHYATAADGTPLDEAQDNAAAAIEHFADAVIQHRSAMRWAEHRNDDPPPPPQHLLTMSTGVGKSHEILRIAASLAEEEVRSLILVPRHGLSDDLCARAKNIGIQAAIWRGYEADDPEIPGKQMCWINDLGVAVTAAGGDRSQLCSVLTMTRRVWCRHASECGRKRQEAVCAEADVVIAAHKLLTTGIPRRIGQFEALFVDEDPTNVMLNGVGEIPVTISPGELDDLADILDQRSTRPRKPRRGAQIEIRLFGRDEAMAEDAALLRRMAAAIRAIPTDGDILPGNFPPLVEFGRGVWGALESFEVSPMAPLDPEMLKEAGRIFSMVRRATRLADIVKAAAVTELIPGLRRTETGLIMRWKSTPKSGFKYMPKLFANATARQEVLEALFGPFTVVEKTKVSPEHVTVRQVTDWSASRGKLLYAGNERAAKTATNNMARLRRYVEVRAAAFRGEGAVVDEKPIDVLLVTYKDAVIELQAAGLPDNVEVAHFGGLTGIDRWNGVRCLIVGGRPMPGVPTVENIAEVVAGMKIAPIDTPDYAGWYARENVGGWVRGEDVGPALPLYHHTDPVAEAVRWTMCEGELLQAIGRGRENRRTEETPLQIDIVTNVPLPVEVDEFVTWVDAQPNWQEVMAARGVVLEVPSSTKGYWPVVAAVLPDMFKDAKAAKDYAPKSSRPYLHIDKYISKCGRETLSPTNVRKKDSRYWLPARIDLARRPGLDDILDIEDLPTVAETAQAPAAVVSFDPPLDNEPAACSSARPERPSEPVVVSSQVNIPPLDPEPGAVEADPPPQRKTYDELLEEHSGGGWILPEDEDRALGDWLRQRYIPPSPRDMPQDTGFAAYAGVCM